MALSDINKFSPYLNGTNSGLLFPKLSYRFRVTLSQFGGQGSPNELLELSKQVVTCGRPDLAMSRQPIDTYNSKVYFIGKPEWQELSLTVRDDINGNISKIVGQQVQKQFDFLEQASAAASSSYKFSMQLDMLDGGNGASAPITLEQWQLTGCMLTKVTYGDMDYSKNDPMTVVMSISFDNAVQTDSTGNTATGIGVNVGRSLGDLLG